MVDVSHEQWQKENKWEAEWWGNCFCTIYEENKQGEYLQHMGLGEYHALTTGAPGPVYDLQGKSVLDVGGGPVSLLLRCKNRGHSVIVDPCDYPQWCDARYDAAGIEHLKVPAEEMEFDEKFDEVWFYNVLQHTMSPDEIIKRCKKYGKKIRFFEWLNMGVHPGHPQNLTEDLFRKHFGRCGSVVQMGQYQAFAGSWTQAESDKLARVTEKADSGVFRFHLLGLAHLPSRKEISSCAYTQKNIKLAHMLKSLGHEVYFYGVEGSEVDCTEMVECLSEEQRLAVYGSYDYSSTFFKGDGGDAAYAEFNKNAIQELKARVTPVDFLLCSMGLWQKPIADAMSGTGVKVVESGIGYEGVFSDFRVYESYAWMHHLYGKGNINDGRWYDAVIPNYFDLNDFPYQQEKEDWCLFIGRLTYRKGLDVAVEATKRAGRKLIVAGQGNLISPEHKLNIRDAHVQHIGMVGPEKRAELMGKARCVMVPTYYLEPFGGVAVEAQLCFPSDTKIQAKGIERLYSHMYNGWLLSVQTDNESIECTSEHPFLTQRGWVAAKNLKIEDLLVRRIGHEEVSSVDTSRIGDVVKRLSKSGSSGNCEIIESTDILSSAEGESSWVAQGQQEMVYARGNGDYQETLSESWRGRSRENAWSISSQRAQESNIDGGEVRDELETIYGTRNGTNQRRICNAWSNCAWEKIEQISKYNESESGEVGVEMQNNQQGKFLSSNNDSNGIGILCGDNRWGGNDNIQNVWKRQAENTTCDNSKHIRCDCRVDTKQNHNSERNSIQKTISWGENGERKSFELHADISQRFQLHAVISRTSPVFSYEEAADGNDYRVVRTTPTTREDISGAVRENEPIGTDGSVYEYTRIRSISCRKVENLPVYNLGTRSGIYEANGLIVHNCGTPVVTSDWGAFSETVLHGKTGYRCRTIEEFTWAIQHSDKIAPADCRRWAEANYSMDRVALMYQEYFDRLNRLRYGGWYAENDGRQELGGLAKVYP